MRSLTYRPFLWCGVSYTRQKAKDGHKSSGYHSESWNELLQVGAWISNSRCLSCSVVWASKPWWSARRNCFIERRSIKLSLHFWWYWIKRDEGFTGPGELTEPLILRVMSIMGINRTMAARSLWRVEAHYSSSSQGRKHPLPLGFWSNAKCFVDKIDFLLPSWPNLRPTWYYDESLCL